MYSDHPVCDPPKDKDIKIWRYMDMSKLLSLIEEKALYFPSITTLDDPLEGFLNKGTVEQLRQLPDDIDNEERKKSKDIIENNLKSIRDIRNIFYVSSWHMNNHESAAMWKIYSSENHGIAIQSTYNRLKNSIIDQENVYIGTVKYIEEKDIIDWKNAMNYILHKRMSFKHEEELRAVVLGMTYAAGCKISVSIEELIEKIYIAPTCPSWINELIKKIITRYNLQIPTEHSLLIEEDPLY